ncbi:MAG: PepSY-associated TM helix domain-containing protein [Pseudomonadota bacterium]
MRTGKLPSRRTLRPTIVRLHRWLGLAAAVFWLLQAITGSLIVFHWELRDAAIGDVHRPTDLAAIERRLTALAPPAAGAAVGSMWTTAGLPDRYDIYYTDANGEDRSARILGDGTLLDREASVTGGALDTMVGLHHDLLAGPTGDWIVAISGTLLVSNLIAGLVAAWPRKGTWAIALKPSGKGNAAARLYSWHRAIGLWLVLPALLIATTGTLLKFPDGVSKLLGADTPGLPPVPARGAPIGFASAVGAAMNALPGSALVSVSFPETKDATYSVLLRTPDEMRNAYGASRVLIDANDGSVRGRFPIAAAPIGTQVSAAIVPIHTGQAAGLIGRLIVLTIGLSLAAMIVTGPLLWARRRRTRRAA